MMRNLVISLLLLAAPAFAESGGELVKLSGVTGGVVVQLGPLAGASPADLRINDHYIVQALLGDGAAVRKVRDVVAARGRYGAVTVRPWQGKTLPFADELVNLVVAEGKTPAPLAEIHRVLAPNGVLLTRARPATDSAAFSVREAGSGWFKAVKPWPADRDEWTHWLHSSDNNAVSRDELKAIPRALQWIEGPLWLKSHELSAALSAMVTARGRLFTILDESAPGMSHMPDRWSLIARDAFNGVLLWKRPIRDWGVRRWRAKSTGDWGGNRFSNPHQVLRRLVAAGDRVYVTLGVHAPVSQLDAATGKVLRTYKGTDKAFEILCSEGTLYLAVNKSLGDQDAKVAVSIMAVEAESGKVVWERPGYKGLRPTLKLSPQYVDATLTAGTEGVFFADRSEIVALDRKTGKTLWTVRRPPRSTPPNVERAKGYYVPDLCTLVYNEGIVFFSQVYDRKNNHPKIGTKPTVLFAVDAASGKKLWSIDTRSIIHFTPPDVFVNGGLVWVIDDKAPAFMGLDPRTGAKKRTIDASLIWKGYHHNCFRNKATRDFILYGRNKGVEFFNMAADESKRVNWIKGACRYGIMPANGMLYMPSHNCACHATAKLNGVVAIRSKEHKALKPSGPDAVTKGPAFAKTNLKPKIYNLKSNDWPTYRKDARRSAFQPAAPRGPLAVKWTAKVGPAPAPPVIADGKVFVVAKDSHTVHCLDEAGGKRLWTYTAGGRIDSPPTWCKGRLVFGGRDGVVTALDADSGALIWSFRAAPGDSQIVAFGQVESLWPCHGTLLVQDDRVYCSAGRSTYLDGGMYAYALDLKTGRPLASRRLAASLAGGGEMQGGVNSDLFVSDGKRLNMRGMILATDDLAVLSEGIGSVRIPNSTPTNQGTYLTAMGGFLDDSFFNVAVWRYGKHVGNMLAMDGEEVFGVRVYRSLNIKSSGHSNFRPGQNSGLLFAAGSKQAGGETAQSDKAKAKKGKRKRKGSGGGGGFRWQVPLAIRGSSMVVGSDRLFLAGVEDKVGDDDPWAFYDGKKGARLLVCSRADGKVTQELKLTSVPVFDGMAAAGGRLFISCTDGSLICLAAER